MSGCLRNKSWFLFRIKWVNDGLYMCTPVGRSDRITVSGQGGLKLGLNE